MYNVLLYCLYISFPSPVFFSFPCKNVFFMNTTENDDKGTTFFSNVQIFIQLFL